MAGLHLALYAMLQYNKYDDFPSQGIFPDVTKGTLCTDQAQEGKGGAWFTILYITLKNQNCRMLRKLLLGKKE